MENLSTQMMNVFKEEKREIVDEMVRWW